MINMLKIITILICLILIQEVNAEIPIDNITTNNGLENVNINIIYNSLCTDFMGDTAAHANEAIELLNSVDGEIL